MYDVSDAVRVIDVHGVDVTDVSVVIVVVVSMCWFVVLPLLMMHMRMPFISGFVCIITIGVMCCDYAALCCYL